MAASPSGEPTVEQRQLFAELRERYGAATLERANHLSGLALCLVALASDDALTKDQRKDTYKSASYHLSRLLSTMLSAEESAAVSECAKRLDAALDTWMLDDIEARDGLPPA